MSVTKGSERFNLYEILKMIFYTNIQVVNEILDAFSKLRNATISFVMSVRHSAWNITPSVGRIFVKFYISVQSNLGSRN